MSNRCHICGFPRDSLGSPICSAVHLDTDGNGNAIELDYSDPVQYYLYISFMNLWLEYRELKKQYEELKSNENF